MSLRDLQEAPCGSGLSRIQVRVAGCGVVNVQPDAEAGTRQPASFTDAGRPVGRVGRAPRASFLLRSDKAGSALVLVLPAVTQSGQVTGTHERGTFQHQRSELRTPQCSVTHGGNVSLSPWRVTQLPSPLA